MKQVYSQRKRWLRKKWRKKEAYNINKQTIYIAHTHTFNGPFSRTTRVGRYQKSKTNLDFTEARDSEWQWHQLGICKSAPRSRQITTPAPHHSVFYRPDALPAAQPTASKHWRHKTIYIAPKSKIKSKAHYAPESAWGFHVQIRHSAIHGEQCHHA